LSIILTDPNPIVRMTLDVANLTDLLVTDGIDRKQTGAPSG
jgi:hypothetical protein